MSRTTELNPEDLVLGVDKENVEIDLSKYEDFIMALCGEREYQMEAIRDILSFYQGEQYDDIESLVRKNYSQNEKMQEAFSEADELVEQLQFQDKKSCTIDFATGTGKSWVMYGVARIMMCEGLVDRVLVLAPSTTVRKEIIKKFKKFSQDDRLRNSLPDGEIMNPSIIDSSETIEEGDICIDNIHKTYSHTSSSIEDSLEGKGQETLVINDEAHHLLNPKSHAGRNDKSKMREWEKFLKDDDYGFNFILNSTGTPYKGDNYFKDIISRYSLTEAMESEYIKEINYLEKDESENWDEKRLAIYRNHKEIKEERYTESDKHITIFVTDAIKRTDEIAEELREFLMEKEDLTEEEAEEKVIPVSSSSRHEEYVDMLDNVDSPKNPVEWIVSVSMLTEGWDVENIYQIVPHDKRAFNSKLLISQVLGRGLRVPEEYRGPETQQPEVLIYNHDSWSNKIDNLVREVAEISKTIRSRVIEDRGDYNFELDLMDKKKSIQKKLKEKSAEDKEVTLPSSLGFKSESGKREQVYKSAETEDRTVRKTDVSETITKYTVEEAVNELHSTLKMADMSNDTNFAEKADKDYLRNLIREELEEIGEDKVSEDNLQRAKNAFNVIFKDITGNQPIIEYEYEDPVQISTADMGESTISVRQLKTNAALVYSDESLNQSTQDEKETIREGLNEVKGKFNIRTGSEHYKCPLNTAIMSYSNEIEFGRRLVREEHATEIDAWVKSPDQGFYAIPYIYRPGTHSRQKTFNPDFIIKDGEDILIVEIKSDDDTSLKNKDKLKGAKDYFSDLNEAVEEREYHFYFLSPDDYTNFFEEVVKAKNYDKRFELQSDLLQKSRSELKDER